MAASRYGSDLVRAQPKGYRVPAKLAADADLGANTLVGIQDDGYVGDIDASGDNYVGVLFAREEIDNVDGSDGDVVAKEDLATDVVVKLTGSGFTEADVGSLVFATDHETVTTTEGTDGRPQAGRIVEVVAADTVYVHIDPALMAAGATA